MVIRYLGTMFEILFVILTLVGRLVMSAPNLLHPLSDDFIDLINKEGKWKAGRNFPPDTPMEYIKSLAGTYMNFTEYKKFPVMKHDPALIASLPESFDPRDKWPNCTSLNEIRDQGRCGACWVFGPIEAMTDRVCTYSNGSKNFHFSAEDLLTCQPEGESDHNGCFGGSPHIAWNEWINVGFVSGGNYNSHEGCKPYSIATCLNHFKNCTDYKPAPPCVKSCEDGYNTTYVKDKKRGKTFYFFEGEDDIKAELYKNGPVSAAFMVYEDFADYKSGVYQHVRGEIISGHAVKMLGWGVENGTKYWLAANSWGPDFGENGFFKILRGVQECFIEEFVIGGEPLMEEY